MLQNGMCAVMIMWELKTDFAYDYSTAARKFGIFELKPANLSMFIQV
jgi:hypothetical protein